MVDIGQHDLAVLVGKAQDEAFGHEWADLFWREVSDGQHLTAKQLLIMPLSTFDRLATQVGDPDDRNVSLIHMTVRFTSNDLAVELLIDK